jgi:hypothetical protein
MRAHTACSLRSFKIVPSKWHCLIPPRRVDWRSRVETTSTTGYIPPQKDTFGDNDARL